MILYLRNKENRTIVDVEIYVKKQNNKEFVELRSVIVIETYSKFLLENIKIANQIINDFQIISELRGYMWEDYFLEKDNTPEELNNVIKIVSEHLKNIGKKFDLTFVTD
jgi:hypothetical protein